MPEAKARLITSWVTIKPSSFLTLSSMSLVRRGLNIDCSMPQATMLQSKIRHCTLVCLLTRKRLFLPPSLFQRTYFAPLPTNHPCIEPTPPLITLYNIFFQSHACINKLVLCQRFMLQHKELKRWSDRSLITCIFQGQTARKVVPKAVSLI